MKRFAFPIVIISIYFALAVVLIWSDLDFKTFNFWEGMNWLVLGIFFLTLPKIISAKYKKAALFASFVLILFGVSDFVEIRTGGYWIPWQLLAFKVFCLAGMVFSLAWFAKLRFSLL
jgi:hypothetical protein